MSCAESSSAFIPAVDDAWAVLSLPPGRRDLALPEYWTHSHSRSLRRRSVQRGRVIGDRGSARLGVAVAALALGGGVVSVSGTDDAAAAKVGTSTYSLELSRGSKGPAVKALQARLGIPADGIFGPQTEGAVKRFQRANGIPAIGRVGPQTTAALGLKVTARERTATLKQVEAPAAVDLSPAAARALQAKLGVTVDGIIGPQTRGALKRWEAANGLPADGRPDAQVLQAMGIDPSESGDAGSEAQSAPAPQAASGASGAVQAAASMVGVPYRSAGTTPAGFDCSGLVQYVFKKAGISLPRTSFSQYGVGTAIKKSQIQAGDLVFFDTNGGGASHVGIATGPNTAISATTHGVREHSISDSYWGSHYVGAKRVTA